MKILAHRGFWQQKEEKNSIHASSKAIEHGFGIELDIRDQRGNLIVSHDIPRSTSDLFKKHLELSSKDTIWAINIKADGLARLLKNELELFNINRYFAFDMSIPEMFVYANLGIDFYTSMSDICRTPPLLSQAKGIWLDSFCSLWYDGRTLEEIANLSKPVCVVSEDLHGRPYLTQWEILKNFLEQHSIENWQLCTDHPMEAKEFFHD